MSYTKEKAATRGVKSASGIAGLSEHIQGSIQPLTPSQPKRMHSVITKRLMAPLITVALLCCVVILFTPSISFIPGTDVRAASRMGLLPTTTDSTTTDSTTTDSSVESKIQEDLEFHAKQGASIKLDFNRLALEDMNSVKASSGISDSNSLGASDSLAGPENLKDLEVKSNLRDVGKKDYQSDATTLNLTNEAKSQHSQMARLK